MADYAYIESGSKQFRVEPNQKIEVECLNLQENQKEVILDKVLLVRKGENIKIGTPHLSDTKVVCEYLEDFRAPKVITLKYRRRKNSRRIRGHRQNYSRLFVKEIVS